MSPQLGFGVSNSWNRSALADDKSPHTKATMLSTAGMGVALALMEFSESGWKTRPVLFGARALVNTCCACALSSKIARHGFSY